MRILAIDPGTEKSDMDDKLYNDDYWLNSELDLSSDILDYIPNYKRKYKNNLDKHEDKEYKVYRLICPENKVYIGITSLPINYRVRKSVGYKKPSKMYYAIEKHGFENIKLDVLYSNITLHKALHLETMLIRFYNSNCNDYGYNSDNGGLIGPNGKKVSQEMVEAMRIRSTGRVQSPEERMKKRNAMLGRKFTEEHRRKMRESQLGEKNHQYGKKASEEVRAKMRASQKKGIDNPMSVKVDQFDLDGNLVRTFNSLSDIRRELGHHHCCISDCCRGRQKTAYGFIWKYHNA